MTVSIEWARHGSIDLRGFARTAIGVLTNPIVASILAGIAFGSSGLQLPVAVSSSLSFLSSAAGPAALLVLGMGLSEHRGRRDLPLSAAICGLKLVVSPLLVWALARAIGLPAMETKVVVLLASLSVGANVYLMAVQFERLQGEIASSLLWSTAPAALTTPVCLWALG